MLEAMVGLGCDGLFFVFEGLAACGISDGCVLDYRKAMVRGARDRWCTVCSFGGGFCGCVRGTVGVRFGRDGLGVLQV